MAIDDYHACELSQCTTHMCAIIAQYYALRFVARGRVSVCTNLYIVLRGQTLYHTEGKATCRPGI